MSSLQDRQTARTHAISRSSQSSLYSGTSGSVLRTARTFCITSVFWLPTLGMIYYVSTL